MSAFLPLRFPLMVLASLVVPDAMPAQAESVSTTTALAIDSDSACPSSDAIRSALVDLRPVDEWPATQVVIRAQEHMLVVEIGTDEIKRRQLSVGFDCATRATTVALILATWMNDLPAQSAGLPILRSLPADNRLKTTAETKATAEGRHSEINLGLLAAVGDGIVPGFRADYTRLRSPSGLGWQVSVALPAARKIDLGSGVTYWTRPMAGFALAGRLASRKFYGVVDAGAVAALTIAWGQGYTVNQTDQSFTGGPTVGVRMGISSGRFQFWTDLRVFRWLYGQSVKSVDEMIGREATASLPLWEGHFTLGVGYVFR